MRLTKQLLAVVPICTLSIPSVKGAELPHDDDGMILQNAEVDDGEEFGILFHMLPQPNPNESHLDFSTISTDGAPVCAAFQPKIYIGRAVRNAPYKSCVYFTIKVNGNDNTIANQPGGYHVPQEEEPNPNTQVNVYFPLDGEQPKTETVAKWSCANVDPNIEDSPVTKWYMTMFGVSPEVDGKNETKVQAGFCDKGTKKAIINIGLTMLDEDKKQFTKTFRILAANPVGRVLLYRILIELRRLKSNEGTIEDGIDVYRCQLESRMKRRALQIKKEENFTFAPYDATLGFAPRTLKISVLSTQQTTTGSNNNDVVLGFSEKERPLDVALFHEMLHWYHNLRNPDRYLERTNSNYKYALKSYYGNIDEEPATLWAGDINDEELRAILGYPDHNIKGYFDLMPKDIFFKEDSTAKDRSLIGTNSTLYIPKQAKFLNGDDLSENVYRISKTLPMRFSHTSANFTIQYVKGTPPNRLKLAHTVALDCYKAIYRENGNEVKNWELKIGQAIAK